MSMAGITCIPGPRSAVVGELEGDRDRLVFAKRLDHRLERVLLLAGDPQLVALDPDLDFVRAFLRRVLASSSEIPALSSTVIWPRHLPTVRGSDSLKSLGERLRRAAFSL